MKDILNQADELSRRSIMQGLAASFLGLQYTSSLQGAQSIRSGKAGQAKSVIFVNVGGGISHVDSFDIKEGNKIANDKSEPIKTSADGIRIGKYFKNMAQHMDKFAVINSMHHTQGVHDRAQYLLKTAYVKRGTVNHPEIGAWVSKMTERRSGDIPAFVKVGKAGAGNGFFSAQHASLPITNPLHGLAHSRIPKGSSQSERDDRLGMLDILNSEFENKFKNPIAENYHVAYNEATKLMKSKDLAVFNMKEESDATKKMYGENQFGYSCLLARRLVEKGVNFIQVGHGGWDDHHGLYDEYGTRAESLDQGVAALITDLKAKGLLDSTMVAFATEFGRGAILNSTGGRGHNPAGYTCMLAGGGIQGGQKYGETDKIGQKAVKDKVSVGDYNATLAYALGMPVDHVEMSPQARPFKVGSKDGKPLTMLF